MAKAAYKDKQVIRRATTSASACISHASNSTTVTLRNVQSTLSNFTDFQSLTQYGTLLVNKAVMQFCTSHQAAVADLQACCIPDRTLWQLSSNYAHQKRNMYHVRMNLFL